MKKIFKGKKVVVMGLGLLGGGVGAAKFFVNQGAKLLVTDLREKKELSSSLEKLKGLPIKYVFGKHRKEDFTNADLIIKNPAVAPKSYFLKIAREHNIPIKTDISIFFDFCPAEIIGVTGTKGKSTTATLIYKFLKTEYPDAALAGNIGISPLEVLPRIKKKTKVVLELSSFELEDLKKSPEIAIITTLFPDHLNRYKNFREYVKAKKAIFKYQKKDDILILNYNNPETRKLAREARSKVYFFTPLNSCEANLTGVKDSNLSAALAVAKIFKIPQKNIKKVLAGFKGVPSRQELVAIKKGVKYINDTTATTPQSAIFALNVLKKKFPRTKIILISGGQDKNLNYKNLAQEIRKKVSHLILLPGTASDKIRKELSSFKELSSLKEQWVKSMKAAVKKASALAQKGDIVLLSPGAASFNLFRNEFDRGKQFIRALREQFS